MIGRLLELRRLRRHLRLPAAELEALQARRLRAAIAHACERVPFYRDLFRRAGLRPDDIRSVHDLRHVPITTKQDLRAAGPESILASGFDRGALHAIRTSGSTGHPFTVLLSRADRQTRSMIELRGLLAIGLRPTDRLLALGPVHALGRGLHQRLGLYRTERLSSILPFEEQVARIRAFDPTVLWAYPSALRALIRNLGRPLAAVCRPRALITSSGVFDPSVLEPAGATGIERFNFYACVETGRIAWECRAHRGLHVNTDHVVLELEPLAAPLANQHPGLGVTVVTTLSTRAMPLIRYRLGDLCRYLDEPCPCGCALPLIGPPVGRQEDLVRLPSGRVISADVFMYMLRPIVEIDGYRAIQKALDHFVVELASATELPPRLLEEIGAKLRAAIAEPVRLEIRPTAELSRSGRKHQAFRSELAS